MGAVTLTPPQFRASSGILGLAGDGIAAAREPGKTVAGLEPGNLAFGPDMVLRLNPLRFIQASRGDLDSVRKDLFVHGKRAAAGRAKAALGEFRGPVSLRFWSQPQKRVLGKMDEAQAGTAGVLAALFAIANHAANGRGGGAVSDGTAKAPSFEWSVRH